ncbi:MAG: class I SAM-dependent DNA methyltransferase [Candidatus Hodarchaeales archaeon]|jgi:ubiquinone/menaquinone biosynthesis C-methylase UbiE
MNTQNHYNFLANLWDEMYLTTTPYEEGYRFIDSQRAKFDLPKKILDVACGTGILLQYFENANYEVIYGSDLSREMINKAKSKLTKTEFKVSGYSKISFDQKVGIIISFFNSFAYCKNTEKLTTILKHLKTQLVPNGLIIFDIFTVDTATEIFDVKSFEFEKTYVSRTFIGTPEKKLFKSKMLFIIIDRQTKRHEVVLQNTVRGIFSTTGVSKAIKKAGLKQLKVDNGYMHETFIAQNII